MTKSKVFENFSNSLSSDELAQACYQKVSSDSDCVGKSRMTTNDNTGYCRCCNEADLLDNECDQ